MEDEFIEDRMEKLKGFNKIIGRAWCFTVYDEQMIPRILEIPKNRDVRAFVIGGIEVCPTTGREHRHGYIRFKENVKGSYWSLGFPKLHVEKRRQSELAASEYCTKEGAPPIIKYGCATRDNEEDEKITGKKRKNDVVEDVLDMIEDGAPNWEIYKKHRIFYFWHASKIKDLQHDINGKYGLEDWKQRGVQYKRDD